jgi:hypothetical protein
VSGRTRKVGLLSGLAVATAFALAVTAGATQLGSQTQITDHGGPGNTELRVAHPDVAYNPETNQYLLAYLGDVGDTTGETDDEVFGLLLDSDGEPVDDPFVISGAAAVEDTDFRNPVTVNYAPEANEWLVSWTPSNDGDVLVQRIDADGNEVGPDDLEVTDEDYNDIETSETAYDPDSGTYLVVWKGDQQTGPAGGQQVYGQRVELDGDEVGDDDFQISQMSEEADDAISIARNSANGEVLVVWRGEDDALPSGETEIWGQRLEPDGDEVGDNDFRISDAGPDGNDDFEPLPPRVAYNAVDDEYLVAWAGEDDAGGLVDDEREVYGQRLNASGAPIGANDFRLSDLGPDGNDDFQAFRPDIAHNTTLDEWFLAWHGDDDTGALVNNEFEIWSQRLDADGGQIFENDLRVSQIGTDGDPDDSANAPAVAFNSQDCEYLTIFFTSDFEEGSEDQNFEVYGRVAALNDVLIGKAKRNRKRGTAKLTVEVSGSGTLVISGKKVKRKSKQVGSGGEVKLPVKAKGKAKKRLKDGGKARVRAKVEFSPESCGDPTSETKRVKLVKRG